MLFLLLHDKIAYSTYFDYDMIKKTHNHEFLQYIQTEEINEWLQIFSKLLKILCFHFLIKVMMSVWKELL